MLFADFNCGKFPGAVASLNNALSRFRTALRVVVKPVTDEAHVYGEVAARAALAAQEQGCFWEMHDALCADSVGLTPEGIRAAAQRIHLDIVRWQRDMDGPVVAAHLAREMADATAAGVEEVPALFLNGSSPRVYRRRAIYAR